MKEDARFLLCGRMAHPVSRRVLSKYPGAIPQTGLALSEWHKEVCLHIAGLYDATIYPWEKISLFKTSKSSNPVFKEKRIDKITLKNSV